MEEHKVDIGSTKEGKKTHDDADNEESSNNSRIPRMTGLNWLQPWKKICRGERSHEGQRIT